MVATQRIQVGVISPVMSNIYLHRLDEFVETVLIPEYTRGRIRKQDTGYALPADFPPAWTG